MSPAAAWGGRRWKILRRTSFQLVTEHCGGSFVRKEVLATLESPRREYGYMRRRCTSISATARQAALAGLIPPRRAFEILCCAILVAARASHSSADPHYIKNLTFSDRSPGSSRANSFEPVRQLDADDSSFASAAGWEGGFITWQKQFDHSQTLAAADVAGELGETLSFDNEGQ